MICSAEKERGSVVSYVVLALIVAGCLLPFVNKAFHIDDTLFIKTALHIQTDPLNFYGFTTNWYGFEMPMSAITKNPPLASYYSALIASLFGWREMYLHLGFFLFAVAAALGTYNLAKELCSHPLTASLAGILTPVFLVSSSTVMCDTMMLAFWVWALFFWKKGISTGRISQLLLSALLIAACSLSKYYGMSLIPLVIAYSLAKKRTIGYWALPLLIPIVLLAGYQYATQQMYGRGLLFDAGSYALEHKGRGAGIFFQAMTGLAFTGGCITTVLCYTPLLWRKAVLVSGVLVAILIAGTLPLMERIGNFPLHTDNGINWIFIVQYVVFLVGGVTVFALAVVDFRARKDSDSFLLLLWIAGTFIFATFLNWSLNGRSILPMVPAVGILLMRRIEARETPARSWNRWHMLVPLVPAVLIAFSVTWGDYNLAGTAREAAAEIRSAYGNNQRTVWFQGHWGFQQYMEMAGGKALDIRSSYLTNGDVVVIPSNNTNVYPLFQEVASHIGTVQVASNRWVSTMSRLSGAGFYSDLWGPLPFAFGPAPPEIYYVLLVNMSVPAQAACFMPGER